MLRSIQDESRKILTSDDIEYLSKMKYAGNKRSEYQLRIHDIEKEIHRKESYKRKTYENYMEELISKEEYRSYVKEYESDISDLKKQRQSIKEQISKQDERDNEYDEWVEKFKNYIDIDELTREVVLELIERIEVNEDGSVNMFYKFKNPYAATGWM